MNKGVCMELDLKNYQNRHSLKSKIVRVIWNGVWLLLFRTTPRGALAEQQMMMGMPR